MGIQGCYLLGELLEEEAVVDALIGDALVDLHLFSEAPEDEVGDVEGDAEEQRHADDDDEEFDLGSEFYFDFRVGASY